MTALLRTEIRRSVRQPTFPRKGAAKRFQRIGAKSSRPFWLAPADRAALVSDDASRTADVVVIGGGIMGVATTYWLAQRGAAVQLLEAETLCFGATGRNIGLFLPNSNPIEAPEIVETIMAKEEIDAGYAVVGHLALAASLPIWEGICSEARDGRYRGRIEALDRTDCETLLQTRLSPEFLGGRWDAAGRAINPVRLTRGLATAARRRGARISQQQRVRDIVSDRRTHVVRTNTAQISAKHVVVACNAWSPFLLPELRCLITPVPAQVLATEPGSLGVPLGLALDRGTVYWRQASDGTTLAGGFRQLDRPTDSRCMQHVNPAVQSAITRFLSRATPERKLPRIRNRWAGIMDTTPDGRPVAGRIGDSNVWIAMGLGGHGLPPALGIARAIAAGLSDGIAPHDIEPFRVERFFDNSSVLS